VQSAKVQEKIEFVLKIIKTIEKVPEKFFKHLEGTDGLYEIRIEFRSNIYRIFCCFDEAGVVMLFNAFQKKTQKTQRREIEIALRLKDMYFKTKKRKL
jgi:phage-related protein